MSRANCITRVWIWIPQESEACMELGEIKIGLDGPIPRTERMERLIQRFDELSFASPNMPGCERYRRVAWLYQSCGEG